MTDREMLEVALEEARPGLAEGGIPIGAALFAADGRLLGPRPQPAGAAATTRRCTARPTPSATPAASAPTATRSWSPRWRRAGTAAGSCASSGSAGSWSASRVNFPAGIDWLRERGVEVIDLDVSRCVELLGGFIAEHPEIWNEDIGED